LVLSSLSQTKKREREEKGREKWWERERSWEEGDSKNRWPQFNRIVLTWFLEL
jgi:hypothetical protein